MGLQTQGGWVGLVHCVTFYVHRSQSCELSAATVDELWTIAILCVLFVTDLRADICTKFALVDVSNDWEAEVTIKKPVVRLQRNLRLTRAAWSRLLTPLQTVQKTHGSLAPEDEVPLGQEPAAEHPLWTEVVKSSSFRNQWHKRIFNRPPINVSEMSAALRSEARRSRRCPCKS